MKLNFITSCTHGDEDGRPATCRRAVEGFLLLEANWEGGQTPFMLMCALAPPKKKFHVSENKTNKHIRQCSAGRQLPRRCVSVGRDGSQK